MSKYPFRDIEKKWQDYWQANKTFACNEDPTFPKEKRAYVLDMFPYPSGAGLHVGHPEGYTATDIYCRYLRANGYNVLHPMGFDSFGLPAENYAIKTGTHPKLTTEENIARFREQIRSLGFSYDWDREVSTHQESYYRWTQWIFLQAYKKGLAYETKAPINWCPSCLTGLANEEVNSEGKCDRCGSVVSRRYIRQWVMKITAYAERLLEDLDLAQWPEAIKVMQRNWIGRSEGAEVSFKIDGLDDAVVVYTTRPDTLFGATYMALAPEHPLVEKITTADRRAEISAYQEKAALKSDLERTDLAKEKSGAFTGAYAINPVNNDKVPIWISDYVLPSYGTGAIMAVPAHDERDREFANLYHLRVKTVVETPEGSKGSDAGIAVNSDFLNGLPTKEAKAAMIAWLEKTGTGKKTIHYKLRDWLFSRQRYWGEPIPIVHCPKCGMVPLDEKDLPLTLPQVASYAPTDTGESPLALIDEWVNTCCPSCGGPAKRETNTMPQWAGSCWYYLRYLDPHNTEAFCSKEKEAYWLPVDLYVGGAEHAVLHLLYARFWHKILFDLGVVSGPEPFLRLLNQGMILGENGSKMSKSLGNVINPDDVVRESGADSLRMYEMFMGPLKVTKPWNTNGVLGVHRFLTRVFDVANRPISDEQPPKELLKSLHKTIKKVTEDTASLEFNTAIARMMIFINDIYKEKVCYRALWEPFTLLLAPYAPHLGEEMWKMLGRQGGISYVKWPPYDNDLAGDDAITLGVQVNGKLRANITVPKGSSTEVLTQTALADPKIKELLNGGAPKKIIAVPDRIVNIVI